MKINDQITTPDNYKIVVADEWDIARAVCAKADAKFWTPREAVESLRQKGDAVRIWLEILKAGLPSFAREQTYHNLVPSVLRDSFASLIAGNAVTPTFEATHFALGTGSNAASNSDLTLQTETLRAAFTNRSSYTNIAYLDVFFSAAEVGGDTFNEAGIFVDGTGSADSGYLLSRVTINQTLGSSQTLTVNCSITIS